MKTKKLLTFGLWAAVITGVLSACGGKVNDTVSSDLKTIEITNVSYDPTRELYEPYNEEFAKYFDLESYFSGDWIIYNSWEEYEEAKNEQSI